MIVSTYREARASFLDAATAVDAVLDSVPHPEKGPEGEATALDIARLGPPGADRLVVLSSGVHGVEGFAGSALQTEWLRAGAPGVPTDTEVILLHGVNPHGFAWVRRVTEDNVDLNRNFVDFDDPPANPEYDRMADALVPDDWSDATQDRTMGELLLVLERLGQDGIQEAITRGQYSHPTGVFYGGNGPTWSHRAIRELCDHMVGGRGEVTILDLHTGLGPWGYGELMMPDMPDTPGFERATRRFGDDIRSVAAGTSVAAPLQGEWLDGVDVWLGDTALTAVVLEFGTVDGVEVLQALRADAWLHAHGDPTGPEADPIKAQLRAAFIDDDPAWLDALRLRFSDVWSRALRTAGC